MNNQNRSPSFHWLPYHIINSFSLTPAVVSHFSLESSCAVEGINIAILKVIWYENFRDA